MEQHNETHGRDEESLISTAAMEFIVALFIFALGALVVFDSHRLGSGWGADGPRAGYFPFYIGLILCISSAVNMYRGVFGKKRDTGPFVSRGPFKQVLWVLVPAILYVLTIQFLGLYVASTVYVAFFMVVLGKYSWIKSVLVSVIMSAVFFLMFEVWFNVPLYKGVYDLLSFTGY